MKLSVLGTGPLGAACALALRANNASQRVSLVSRDISTSTIVGNDGFPCFHAFPQHRLRVPPNLQLSFYNEGEVDPADGIFVCTPGISLDTAHVAHERTEPVDMMQKSPATMETTVVSRYLHAWCAALHGCRRKPTVIPFVCVFTRGLNSNGQAPADLVRRTVDPEHAPGGLESQLHCSSATERPPLVLTASGPVYASEWARQSASAVEASVGKEARSTAAMSSVDPQQSHQRHSKPFSGTSLVFAINSSYGDDVGVTQALRQILQRDLFHRESVTVLEGMDSADLLNLVNACVPLCAFGAGLVSNSYAGSNASALASYAQHAAVSTETLLNQLVERTAGMPLPPCIMSTIFNACINHTSREFILGRQFDFHFKKMNSLQAVYPAKGHSSFVATIDGLHARMKARSVSSPFYETLMDTFGTLLRASVVGDGLVKEGYYHYRNQSLSPLMQHILSVDAAILCDDEKNFDEARNNLADAFAQDVCYEKNKKCRTK